MTEQPIIGNKGLQVWLEKEAGIEVTIRTICRWRIKDKIPCHRKGYRIIQFIPKEIRKALPDLFWGKKRDRNGGRSV